MIRRKKLRLQQQGSMKRTSDECFNKFKTLLEQIDGWQVETNQANAILALNMIEQTKENYKQCWVKFMESYPEMFEYIGEKETELDRIVSVAVAGV